MSHFNVSHPKSNGKKKHGHLWQGVTNVIWGSQGKMFSKIILRDHKRYITERSSRGLLMVLHSHSKTLSKKNTFHCFFFVQILVWTLQWKIYIGNWAEELSVIYTLFKSASRVVVICIGICWQKTTFMHRKWALVETWIWHCLFTQLTVIWMR